MVNAKSTINVWWKCNKCGFEWRSVVRARVKGTVCPVCADRAVMEGYNDLATTDAELLCEWDYDRNKISPTQISRNSMQSVWWKCSCGHSWKDKISNRTLEKTACKVCEREFLRVLPQLLIMLYCGRRNINVKLNDETIIGVLLDAYIPESKLAFIIIDRGTKVEREAFMVSEHLCKTRGITCICLSVKKEPKSVCSEIKRALRSIHIYISSDNDEDIETARKQFERWRQQ